MEHVINDSNFTKEEKLAILGLNEREAEEFIIYWLPKLESNKYNYIRFATEEEIRNCIAELKKLYGKISIAIGGG